MLLEDPPGFADEWLQVVVENEVTGKNSHDARRVAEMQIHGVDRVLTFNTTAFQRFNGLTPMSPPDVVKGDARLNPMTFEPTMTERQFEGRPSQERDKDRDR